MSKAILNNIDLQTISDIFTGKYTKKMVITGHWPLFAPLSMYNVCLS